MDTDLAYSSSLVRKNKLLHIVHEDQNMNEHQQLHIVHEDQNMNEHQQLHIVHDDQNMNINRCTLSMKTKT